MRIAIQNPFWGKPVAETELSRRIYRAAMNLGWQAAEVFTSKEIQSFAPDFVIALHNNSPKLTEFPTYGCMWNPPSFFEGTEPFVKNVLTYDGYLVSSPVVERWLNQLLINTPKICFQAPFYTSCSARGYRSPDLTHPQLVYLGSNWDEPRFRDLFERLDALPWMQVYGSAAGWNYLQSAYRGTLPFDGESVFKTLHQAGIGLCLHREEHCKTALPSMRIFEIVASGAIAICGEHPFIRDTFGDTVLYLDTTLSAVEQAEQIAGHLEWIHHHPKEAIERSKQAHAIFSERYTLENLLQGIVAHHEELKLRKGFSVPGNTTPLNPPLERGENEASLPDLQCIVIDRSLTVEFLKTSLKRLLKRSYPKFSMILVSHRSIDQLTPFIESLPIQVVYVSESTYTSRWLWEALECVTAPYFSVLDTDSVIYSNHFYTLVSLLEQTSPFGLAYSGFLKQDGSENTRLEVNSFQPFHLTQFLTFQLPIAPHGWVARRSLLDNILSKDPLLNEHENLCLLMYLKQQTDFLFSYEVTCEWNGYTSDGDRPLLDQFHGWNSELSRLKFLFWHQEFAPGISLQSVHDTYTQQRYWQELANHYREAWERSQAQLQNAEGTIAAMKTSKFWKLRELWQRVKGS